MKKLITSVLLGLTLAFSGYAVASGDTAGKGEMKEVCHPKKDKAGKEVKDKNGKVVQECKMIKVRNKLEGTEIPPAKK